MIQWVHSKGGAGSAAVWISALGRRAFGQNLRACSKRMPKWGFPSVADVI